MKKWNFIFVILKGSFKNVYSLWNSESKIRFFLSLAVRKESETEVEQRPKKRFKRG